MKNGESIKATELSSFITLASAADLLGDLARARKLKYVDLIKTISIVDKQGLSVPDKVCALATKRYAETLLEAEDAAGWVEVIRPWASGGEKVVGRIVLL